MRKLGFLVIFFSIFLFAGCASATTYYISFSSGSNANSGTSESSPWKSHPYMQTASGCSGSGAAPKYNHSSGDQFVFKQGDSWPNACFPMSIQAGGASGNPDVYTYDPTWGTAGGTTGNIGQPVGVYQFTAGGSTINGSVTGCFSFAQNAFLFSCPGANYVTFNGVEMTGQTWNSNDANITFGFNLYQSTYFTVSNCYAHGWTHSGSSDGLIEIEAYGVPPDDMGSRVTGCVFDGINSGGSGVSDSGEAAEKVPLMDNNIVRNMSNGLLPAGDNTTITHDNLIGPINQSFDSSDHENCIEPLALVTNYFYNNVFHDCTAVGILTQGAAPGPGAEIDYLWNNVAYVGNVSGPPVPFQFDSVSTSNGSAQVHAWNNTIYGGSGSCMRTVDRGNGNYAVLDLENNHCISNSGVISLGPTGNSYINKGNVLMSTSTASTQGFSSSETYAYSPASSSSGTVGAGTNLLSLATGSATTLTLDTTYADERTTNTRPTTGSWDVGAYQYSSSGTSGIPTPPTNVKVLVVQ